jgi:hypothetical protein
MNQEYVLWNYDVRAEAHTSFEGKFYLHLHDRRTKGSGNHDEVKVTEEGGPVLGYKPMNVYQWPSKDKFYKGRC